MKVLHLPTSVGGNSKGLCEAEKKLGLESQTLYKSNNWLGYKADRVLSPINFVPLNLFLGAIESIRIKNKFDVLHFNFGSSLVDCHRIGINHLDLPLYKNSKIFVTYNGCDARFKHERVKQTDICACKYADCYGGMCNKANSDLKKEKRISNFENVGANFFSLNPDLMNFLPSGTTFLPYTIHNWYEIKKVPIRYFEYPLHIVHAPSNRVVKGTEAVIKVVEQLSKKYKDKIKLTLVEKTPHSQALKLYENADLIIDQLRIGWYGAFAVEVMKMGKPVVAYINEDDLKFIPKNMADKCLKAIISSNEYNLYENLENIIKNPRILKEKSKAVEEYVAEFHDPLFVAGITKKAYEKEFLVK